MTQRNYLLDFFLNELPCQISAITPDFEETKNGTYRLHRHSSFELHAVLHGSAFFRIGDMDHEVQTHQGILIAPGAYHTLRSTSDDLEKMCVTFSIPRPEKVSSPCPALLSKAFYAQEAIVVSVEKSMDIIRYINTLVENYPTSFWDSERLKAAAVLLLLGVYDELDTPIGVYHCSMQNTSQLIFFIDEFFNLNYNLNNGNELLAKQLHISTRQLDRILQKHYHMTYREKLLEIRLTNALDYLINTDKSVSEISELVGYGMPANFTAFIKRATGKNPSDIRAESRSQQTFTPL